MKFIRQPSAPVTNVSGRTRAFNGWLKEWKANQGKWVVLSCGHNEDMHSSALLIINLVDGCDVYCETCQVFASVVGPREYVSPVSPIAPLF